MVPHEDHAAWVPPDDRPDPVSLIVEQDQDRIPDLLSIRYGRMQESPLAFFRATAALMARDLAATTNSTIHVQLCGDAHLANFGLFDSPERTAVFDLSDFDETADGPWEWDLKRLATSVVLAARENELSESDGRAAAERAVDAYRARIRECAELPTLDVWYAKVDEDEVRETFGRAGRKLARRTFEEAEERDHLSALKEHTKVDKHGRRRLDADPPKLVPLTTEHFADERATVIAVFRDYRERLAPDLRRLLDRFELVDVARKVVGVGSVGRRCWIVLLKGGADDDPLFLQIKEARASVLEPYLTQRPSPDDGGPINQGERVIMGQRLLQAVSDIFLGCARDTTDQADYYLRQLWDDKGEFAPEGMDGRELEAYSQLCGRTLAAAHARAGGATTRPEDTTTVAGDAATIAGYLDDSGRFDEAIRDFAVAYADQTERDFDRFLDAIKAGRIRVEPDA